MAFAPLGQVAAGSTGAGTGSKTSLTVPYTAAVGAGNTVILDMTGNVISSLLSTPTSIVDTQGNVYQLRAGPVNRIMSQQGCEMSCLLVKPVTTADSITITVDNPMTRWAATADGYSGLSDPDASGAASGNSTAPSASTTAATAQADELAHVGYGVPPGQTFNYGTFTVQSNNATTASTQNKSIYTASLRLASVGTVAAAASTSPGSAWVAFVCTYKIAASGPALSIWSGSAETPVSLAGVWDGAQLGPASLTVV